MAKSKIIKELANNEISMEIALNRLLIIASDLDNDSLADWVVAELNGYSKDMVLPTYRKKKSAQFIYSGINGDFQVTRSPFQHLEIIAEYDKNAFDVAIMDSIATLQSFIDNYEKQSYCRDYSFLSGYVYEQTGIQCTSIIQRVPVNTLQNVLSEIKTRLLQILITLDKEYGSLDNLDIDTSNIPPEKVSATNTTINEYIYVDKSTNVGDKNKIESSEILSGGR